MENRLRTYFKVGVSGIALGVLVATFGALLAHFSAIGEFDEFGREAWTWIPRLWQVVLLGQIITVVGILLIIGSVALAFIYERPLTWARAALGAWLFTGLMLIIFAIIPNQWLTLTQAVWEWTPQKIAIRTVGASGGGLPLFPRWLLLNNDISISYAAMKDVVSGTYAVVALASIAVGMYQWQEWTKRKSAGPKPLVSEYGRPMTKAGS